MKKSSKLLVTLLCVALFVALCGLSLAFFSDRVSHDMKFTTATFSKDGYTIEREAPEGPFAADEDVQINIKESNSKSEAIDSVITMSVKWTSPDKTRSIFGNDQAADNATIKVGDTVIEAKNITVSADKTTATFDLPAHAIATGGAKQSRMLTLHIPNSFMSTGEIAFSFEKVSIKQAVGNFSAEYNRTDLNAGATLDCSVRVGWAASNLTSGDNASKALMGFLTSAAQDGKYEIVYQYEYNYDEADNVGMIDFTGKDASRWSTYRDSVVDITIPEGVVSVGDYCFTDFEGITDLDLPESMTAVGAWAFDNISIPSLRLPAKVITFEEMAFGHINELTEITFDHNAGPEIEFPTAGSVSGAFYVDPYVPTTITGANGSAQNYDWVTDQRRVNPVIRSYSYDRTYTGWTAQQVDFHADEYRNTVTSVVFEDAATYYAPENFAAISAMKAAATDKYTVGSVTYWNVTDEASVTENPNAAYSVIAALDSTTGKLTIMGAGTKVLANEDSSFLFGLFENVETIDARKYDTSRATTMEGWHVFNEAPPPEPGEPDYDDIIAPMLGASEILGEENWDMSNVTSIADMFHNAKNIESLSVGNWDTGSLVYANGAFTGCGLLTELEVGDWDMADVVDLRATFARCEGLTYLPVENWDVSKVENLDMTFSRIMGIESLDLSKWDTSSLSGEYGLQQTFQDSGFKSLNVAGWDITGVTYLSGTFRGMANLESLDVSTWDTSNVIQHNETFARCGAENINVTGWEFTNCSGATGVFADCKNLIEITGEETWATTLGTVGTFDSMFKGCENLQSLDIANWDVSGAKYGLKYMFDGCKSLTSIPVSTWDVSVVRTFYAMFRDCESLTDDGIDISGWDMSGMKDTSSIDHMFNGCRSLTTLTFPAYIDFLTYGMAANCPNLETIEFLSTADTLRSRVAPGCTDEDYPGAFYVSPEDAAARYPVNGKIPTTIVTHGAGMASINEGLYTMGKDNRSTPGAENMLMYGSTWYQSKNLRNTVTSITVSMDKADTPAVYDEVWDASVNQDGSIMVYRVGTDLYMIGVNGEIYLNPNSTNAFGSMSGSTQFNQASSFEGLELLNASKLRDATNMFAYFKSAEVLNVSTWDTSNLEILDCTFAGCESLKHLDLTNWTIDSLTRYVVPFDSGTNIEEVTIGAGITDFTLFTLRGLTKASKLTFLHSPDAVITLPDLGTKGAFFVTYRLATTVITDNPTIKEYDWYTVRRDVIFISTPESLAVTTPPAKTQYVPGEDFDPTDMIVTVTYIDGTTRVLDDDEYEIIGGDDLALDATSVTISYTEKGVTVQTSVPISVGNPITGITITTPPTKTEYTEGEDFDKTGMVVTGTFADGTTRVLDDDEYTITNGNDLTSDRTSVTVSSTIDGGTATAEQPITVQELPAMLEPGSTWRQGSGLTTSTMKNITEIQFVDSYTPDGTETASWNADVEDKGKIKGYIKGTKMIVAGNGAGSIIANPDSTFMFAGGFTGVTSITGLDLLDTTKVTTMESMFSGCSALTTLDVSSFDTTNVTDMGRMFQGCSRLTTLDVSGFNTANATNMLGMFSGCSRVTALDVSKFDTTKVTNMASMFSGCSTITALDVSGFDTTNVTNMSGMFRECTRVTTLDVSGFDTTNVTNMSYMFYDSGNLTALDVSGFDTANVTDLSNMFDSCSALTALDVSKWDTANVTNMGSVFKKCSNLITLDVSNWNTANVTNMSGMFRECTKLPALDVSGFVTTNVTGMNYMFYGCRTLATLDVSGFDTGKATSMSYMFYNCDKLTALDVSNWNTANVTDMSSMFQLCTNITALDVSKFDTTKVTNMASMFDSCRALTTLDVSSFDTNKMTVSSKLKNFAADCDSLTTIILGENFGQAANIPAPGKDNGLFYVENQVTTKVDGANAAMEAYVWKTDNRIILKTPPMLLPQQTWFKGTSSQKSSTTEIEFVDSYTPDGTETASWNADVQDKGEIKGYIKGTKLIVAGNGAGSIIANPNSSRMFYTFSKVTSITGLDLLDTAGVTDMNRMFTSCSRLATLDVSKLDTTNVTDMSYMFYNCSSLTTLDVSNWNTAKVTNMASMFYNCSALPTLDVSNWDTTNVIDMTYMFDYCRALTTLDVSNWNTANVTDMTYMFQECSKLTTLDVSNWNTANVTSMNSMFNYCSALTTLDVSNWNTGKVTSMRCMFDGCSKLTNIGSTTNWNTTNVTGMYRMFYGCSALTTLDVSSWNTAKVTDMSYMFYYCSGLTTLDVSNWNTTNVTYMSYMFYGCRTLATLDVSSWNTAKVTDMSYMFSSCSALTTLDVSKWNTANVTNMSYMFSSCGALTTLDVSNWNTANVTNMSYMFYYCSGLTTLDGSKWNTANVTNMSSMFRNCSGLTALDVTGFDTANVTDMSYMFHYCSKVTALDVTGFDTAKVTNMSYMFYNCRALTALDLSSFDTSKITSSSNLKCFATSCTSLTTIILGETFGQAANIPAPGSSTGLFYVRDQLIITKVEGANDAMQAYDWATDNRTVTHTASLNFNPETGSVSGTTASE